jgi:hypothetical protein
MTGPGRRFSPGSCVRVGAGWVTFHSASRRYQLNGGLPADVREALLSLGLADDRRSWWELP